MPAMAMRGALAGASLSCESACSTGFIVTGLAKISFNSSLQHICLFLIRADNKDGVISSNGAYNLRPVFVVDSGCDGLSASRRCHKNQEIHCLSYFKTKAFQDFTNSRQPVITMIRSRGKGVPFRSFVQSQLMNVAGQRRLSHVKPTPCKLSTQFVLTGDRRLYQQILNRGMTL